MSANYAGKSIELTEAPRRTTAWEWINSGLATAGVGALAVGEARLSGKEIAVGAAAIAISGISEWFKDRRQAADDIA